jgi:hypothetical protein
METSMTLFEWKETWKTDGPPAPNPHYPSGVDLIMGASYKCPAPDYLINAEQAYVLSTHSIYWNWKNSKWEKIGGAHDLLLWLQVATRLDGYEDWNISWPEPFPNHYEFHNPTHVQLLPWRELLRCHFDQRAYIADIDMLINDTYKRARRIR